MGKHECTDASIIHEKSIRDVTCPQCARPFRLTWNDYTRIAGPSSEHRYGQHAKQTLFMRGCPSGGIYDVYIECPHCDYHEDL